MVERAVDCEGETVEEDREEWTTYRPNNRVNNSLTWEPTFAFESGISAKQAFVLYFNKDVLQLFMTETHYYASQKVQNGWYHLTLLLLMSVSPARPHYMYWSSDSLFNLVEISKVMPFMRFQVILNKLPQNYNASQKVKAGEGHDKLEKARPLVRVLEERYSQHYTASAHQAIDESMIQFKARSSLKQHMPIKPIKQSYKVWCRADSQTGYLLQFEIYVGKYGNRPEERTWGDHVVLSFCETVEAGTQLCSTIILRRLDLPRFLEQKGFLQLEHCALIETTSHQ